MHQFLSFTRGYWLAIMASVVFSVVVHAWDRRDWRAAAGPLGDAARRARRRGRAGRGRDRVRVGIRGLGELALSRLSSSTAARSPFETSSNIGAPRRGQVITEIIKAPLFGHGLGYSFTVREPIQLTLHEQWFCHENYLLVWLNQGIVGLLLFVWVLFAAVRTGLRGRRLEDTRQQAWCVGAAASAVHIIVYNLVHFPLAEVNTTFTIALLWGGAMAMTSHDWHELHWGPPGRAERP